MLTTYETGDAALEGVDAVREKLNWSVELKAFAE